MVRAELGTNLKYALATGTSVEVIDPETGEVCYLLTAQQFHVARGLLSVDFNPREAYPMIDKVMSDDDASNPWLESYQ